MKAIVQQRYGGPKDLQLRDVETPTPGPDEVLIRVRAASVNPADWHKITGTPYFIRLQTGLRAPKSKIPGSDIAGQVEGVGASATRFDIGDDVFGELSAGGYAEYVCVSETAVAPKPANLTYEQAAAVPMAALTALQGLRDHGRIAAGHHVLINGASGGVGTFAVQIAKALGAEVTAVCSTENLDLVRSLGADHIVDYIREDFTAGQARYDAVFDLVGNRSLKDLRRAMAPAGVYIACSDPGGSWLGPIPWILGRMIGLAFRSQKTAVLVAKQTLEDVEVLTQLIETGSVTPVLDQQYALADAPLAVQRQADGHAKGKTVITI